jgi:hypothetical protein
MNDKLTTHTNSLAGLVPRGMGWLGTQNTRLENNLANCMQSLRLIAYSASARELARETLSLITTARPAL